MQNITHLIERAAMTCPPPTAARSFPIDPAAHPLSAGYDEITAFCDTIMARSEGLNFDAGSLPRAVLSIYMAGGVQELHRLGELEAADCVPLCQSILRDFFGLPDSVAEARALALGTAATDPRSPLFAIFVRGADAFFAWRIALPEFDVHDFRAALEIFPQLAAHRVPHAVRS